MNKRILASFLALVLAFSMLPSVVIAGGEEHVHCLCGVNTTKGTLCAECDSEAVVWTGISAMPAIDAPGYYYLESNVSVAPFFVSSAEFAFCLCGHTMTSAAGKRMFDVSGGAAISITDCCEEMGIITGATGATANGMLMRANAGSYINIYNGKITGNTGSSVDGLLYVDVGTATISGGIITMYGGEISGNTVRRGTLYTGVASGGKLPGKLRILGGTITDNSGAGTGIRKGGAGVYSLYPVEIGGNAKIYGNTATEGPSDIMLRNEDSYTGSLVLSTEYPLDQGTQINYGLQVAETDLTDLTSISGVPKNWKNVWVSYEGQKVGYADGRFFVDDGPADADDGNYGEGSEVETGDHVHCLCGRETVLGNICAQCGSKAENWKAWEELNELPADDGYYYLTGDVTTATAEGRGNIAICLHGNDIISKSGNRLMYVYKNSTITIADCAETAGQMRGSTKEASGSVFWIWAGGELNLYGGHITGNTASSDGTVYVDKSDDASVPGGVLNMYGGEISGNTARRGAGVYMASNGTNVPTIRILGGTITGNTGTGTGATGGGAGIVSFRPLEIGGNAKIYGNTAKVAPNDILLRNDGAFTGTIVVSATDPVKEGAQVNYSLKVVENDLNDLQYISGNPESWDSSWVSYDGQKVGYQDGKFFIDTGIVLPDHIHCLCGNETTEGNTCADCGAKAVAWIGVSTMPKVSAPGYYYLEGDVSVDPFFATSGEFAFCLCGHTMTSAAGKRMFDASNGAVISVTDCDETPGVITGATGATANGMLMRANAGSTINLYNGKITGNSGNQDGVLYVDAGTADTIGGTINIYGGEISGNTTKRGAVFTTVATGSKQPGVLRILGGLITGNTSTDAANGGAGVFALTPVEIGGDAKIYGNTAQIAPADLYIRNDQGGLLVISDDAPLTDGANIAYGTKNPDNTEDLQMIVGNPANWDESWITYDGKSVKYKDGKFYTAAEVVISSHDHDGHSWISMTEETGLLPTKSGYYVLDGDVQLSNQLLLLNGVEVTICLNGHRLTAAEGARHFELRAGSSLTICDCTAKNENGTYIAGKITGGTGKTGGAIYAYAGSQVILYEGILCDNHAAGNGGVIHVNAATATHDATVFHMYGGMICGNSGSYGGAIRLQAPAEGFAGPTFRMEGGIICNNESPDLGGALHAAGGATIELLGGVFENNKAGQGGGAISVNGDTQITLAGTVICNNSATTYGGGLYLQKGAVFNMDSGEISGNSSKIGAGVTMTNQNTVMNLSGGKITANKAGAAGGGGVYASSNTAFNMTGGEISDNDAEAAGGGLVLYRAAGNITGGKITGNHSDKQGGGLVVLGAPAYLDKVIISDNKASSGGGIYVSRANTECTDLMIDGAVISGNTAKASGGGIYMYMNGNAITMKSGKISGNSADNGGGVLVQRECTFTLEGGEISGNTSKSSGGGYYASIDSTFIMNGGTITGNHSNMNGGGIYILRSKFQLNGGSISYNTAKNSSGGVYINGSKGSLNGTWITHNKALVGSGGGVGVSSTTMKVDGVSTRFNAYVAINAGVISNNTTPKAAAGLMVIADGTVVDMYGGQIRENVATKFAGGVYVNKGAAFNMHGGAICYNISETDVAGGLRHDGGTGNHTGGEIYGNSTTRSGGGVYIGGNGNRVTFKNVKIYDNTGKVAAGILHTAESTLVLENCEIYNHTATGDAGAIYVNAKANFAAKDCYFYDNEAQGNAGAIWNRATSYVTLEGCTFENNRSVTGEGGALWTRGDGYTISGCTFRGNTAAGNGGAIGSGPMGSATPRYTPGLIIENSVFEGNTSGDIGGGVYISSGAQGTLRNVTFAGNTAAAEGGAFWAKDELIMHSITATGNKSGGQGYAVYLADSDFDGHSYVAAMILMSGDMKIYDNQGGDLYLGKEVPIIIDGEGLSQDTKIHVNLHSGLLTQWIWGNYNYEGSNCDYIITYGDRSMTNPEYAEVVPEQTELAEDPSQSGEFSETPTEGEKNEPKGSAGLIIGIVAVAAVITAAAIIIVAVSKKKKATK